MKKYQPVKYPMFNTSQLGDRIKSARTRSGMSRRDLAKAVGVSVAAISQYECGKNTPSSPVLIKLAHTLNVRSEYFFRSHVIQLENIRKIKSRQRITNLFTPPQ